MAELQSTNILGTLTVDGTVLGGGKALKYAEFTASATFTPTSEAIDAGGIHQVFIVGGGERGDGNSGGCGGEVIEKYTTLTNTTGCAVTIGAGGTSNGADGGSSTFAGSSAGGIDVVALGGAGLNVPSSRNTSGAGGTYAASTPSATISITAPAATIFTRLSPSYTYSYAYAYQSAYATAYQSAYAYATNAGNGYKGFGAGGNGGAGGISTPKANSGAGSAVNINGASGYCLIAWYE